jgi:hypothetical protein
MDISTENYLDLHRFHYIESGASTAAIILKRVRTGELFQDVSELFPRADEVTQSSAILFSPLGKLIKFYSLLEIALIIKFIPEPTYDDESWREVTDNLNEPLIKSYAESCYPVILPQFLLRRLEGRFYLDEEGIEERYDEASALFSSFVSLTSRLRHPDIEIFLRFTLSGESDPGRCPTHS